ncbi:2-C-methyl-D-erythritol 4-phosphate cytidylyltransferase [Tuwongella immobilis]|uniref:2-C-methyl-D-erythritol 4-phosphate cytidylyltransferase n=1 Tax=Tuwongella immobilis TaxID=692036 RepID=A0A6C2YIX2_9BACT|nr:2-C-methyl-D-erythritol 4-phosphate cytidylyltransferase [Tuwongella immobilis]VIP01490.1 2-c-methyl-d-erythritol 4-phosphate cytidylyltransferase : 2-C-methyl-D-erythritol 4-phosphate cytidylyltransferase OS=Singulisphaera acidiphila (strain ATCC BAA-1392 / DSM 18658 / VKM B-2454 / MOB10) GN=ispD PE=3 SV=1: IspD [Tuwongella immobilis]VTR98562.1 2-c-methyl-d-erythritol 4-phosphate cytidylyltransferase : 2-C-methyl-D-erythritol 4-phosphate cytidylyltransferase OS=Singulisphaera acidiphila (stra
MSRFAVIIPAAGQSTRFGGQQKKPFLPLAGRPIWLRTVELFVTRPDVEQVMLVISPDDREEFQRRFGPNLIFLDIDLVDGGAERFESVANALAKLRDAVTHVAVHDAVRPGATAELIDAVFRRAEQTGGAIPALPVADTLKRVDGDLRITGTVPRQGLWQAQTPQAFRRDWLCDAYARRHTIAEAITDDAQLVEACGHAVSVVSGLVTNFKITTKTDLDLAELLHRATHDLPTEPKPGRPFDDESY